MSFEYIHMDIVYSYCVGSSETPEFRIIFFCVKYNYIHIVTIKNFLYWVIRNDISQGMLLHDYENFLLMSLVYNVLQSLKKTIKN